MQRPHGRLTCVNDAHYSRLMPVSRRSVYMDEAAAADIQRLADRHHRSWSKELISLCRLGYRARHHLPKNQPQLDQGGARQYFYPEARFAGDLDSLVVLKTLDSSTDWSFSAVVRMLAALGMRISEQLDAALEAALARLDAGRESASKPSAKALTLLLRHELEDLLDLEPSPERDAAIDCRIILAQLDADEDPNPNVS